VDKDRKKKSSLYNYCTKQYLRQKLRTSENLDEKTKLEEKREKEYNALLPTI